MCLVLQCLLALSAPLVHCISICPCIVYPDAYTRSSVLPSYHPRIHPTRLSLTSNSIRRNKHKLPRRTASERSDTPRRKEKKISSPRRVPTPLRIYHPLLRPEHKKQIYLHQLYIYTIQNIHSD